MISHSEVMIDPTFGLHNVITTVTIDLRDLHAKTVLMRPAQMQGWRCLLQCLCRSRPITMMSCRRPARWARVRRRSKGVVWTRMVGLGGGVPTPTAD